EGGVVERGGAGLAAGQDIVHKLLEGAPLGGVGAVLGEDEVGQAGNGVGLRPGGVDDGGAHIARQLGFEGGDGGGGTGGGRGDIEAGGVAHERHREVVLVGVGEFDVANGARTLFDESGDAFAAFAAQADRPVDRYPAPHFGLPLPAHRRQIGGEDRGGAAALGTVGDEHRLVGQLHAGIGLGDTGIVPLGDGPQV